MSLSKGLRITRCDLCNDDGSSTLTVAAACQCTHWAALRHCIKSGSDPDPAVRISARESAVASCMGALAILPACGQTRRIKHASCRRRISRGPHACLLGSCACNVLFWDFKHKIDFERRQMHPA
jgi:hypothetical protein